MLRVDKRAGFATQGAWFWKRHLFVTGRIVAERPVSPRSLAELSALQGAQPVALHEADGRRWWWFRDDFYWEDDDLSAHDVMALVVERELRKRRKLERAHAALRREAGGEPRRAPIPRALRLAIWERDGGRCVECASDFELQFDHVIPFSLGGATTAENLQLLCSDCNREKGASL
jgi:5-methylcytosine-specific restriction endonuclease McrA